MKQVKFKLNLFSAILSLCLLLALSAGILSAAPVDEFDNYAAGTPAVLDSATYNGHDYYLLSQSTWKDAEAVAVSMGGHLITINSAAENDYVYKKWNDNGKRWLWIGFTDIEKTSTWKWISNESVTYTNWDEDQPDYVGTEHYAHIWGDGKWNNAEDGTTVAGRNMYGVVEVDPVKCQPNIEANGAKGSITIASNKAVSITASLSPGEQIWKYADWYFAYSSPTGWYSIYNQGWYPGIGLFTTSPLYSFSSTVIFSGYLPVGEYTFYFAVDTSPDGVLNNPFYYDAVQVKVVEPPNAVGNWKGEVAKSSGGIRYYEYPKIEFKSNGTWSAKAQTGWSAGTYGSWSESISYSGNYTFQDNVITDVNKQFSLTVDTDGSVRKGYWVGKFTKFESSSASTFSFVKN